MPQPCLAMYGEKMSKLKKAVACASALLGAAFTALSAVAAVKRADSRYENEPAEKNPLEGKKVEFVPDESKSENADGQRGYLKAVGDCAANRSAYDKYVKRALDVVISFGGLVALSPVLAGVAIAIRIDDPGPVLFTQKRVGENKQYFKLHKFRSMKMSTPHDVPTHMLDNPDQYITKVGKFIRKHSLDELPQIWDIFIGNMSIIGPRPALWNQDVLIAERDKYGANGIKPGLTGLAQISGRDELEIEDKARLDGKYVENMNAAFDIKCFLNSVFSVIKTDGVIEGHVSDESASGKNNAKKSILVVCQYYYPEPFRIADICEELVKQGHEVHVVTGYPNYPDGIIYDGYGKGRHIDENINGVRVHRCFTVPRKNDAVNRMLNYYSYSLSATKYVLSKDCVASNGKPFDIVFCNQLSPVMMAEAAVAYKKKYNVPAIMYCLDLWPESLTAGGIDKKSPVYKYYYQVSKAIYNQMDKIYVTSQMFVDYLTGEFKISGSRLEYLPQYAENIFNDVGVKNENGVFDFMFAGNIGSAQSVETIVEAAKLLSKEPVRFHIVGSGSSLGNIKNISENLDNVLIYGRKPLEEMPALYAQMDAMLVTLARDKVLECTLPGKVQSYMAVGKPIIAAADGETKTVINQAECGFCGSAENARELAENIKKFISENANRAVMGANSKRFYEENFSKKQFFGKLTNSLI